MGSREKIPISVLDLVPIVEGGTASEAFHNSIELAQHVEGLGYNRVWFAEHHSMPAIASAATSIVIARIAAETSTIRVGSGGIMLPNHAPLVIAEQFATLEAMFPGRIDLGLGRAPGSDRATAHALRRELDADDFPRLVQELEYFLQDSGVNQRVRAVPSAAGANIPIWLLGSSGFSAELAGRPQEDAAGLTFRVRETQVNSAAAGPTWAEPFVLELAHSIDSRHWTARDGPPW